MTDAEKIVEGNEMSRGNGGGRESVRLVRRGRKVRECGRRRSAEEIVVDLSNISIRKKLVLVG